MLVAVVPAVRWTGRRVLAALIGGAVAGAAAGMAARLVMYAARVANPAYNGIVTHAGALNGRWTLAGTASIVATATIAGVCGGGLYLLLRPLLRGRPAWRGLEFGVLAFVLFGSLALDGGYEFVRFVSTWVAVVAFAALYPGYGVVLGVLAGRIAPAPPHRRPRLSALGSVVLSMGVAVRAVEYAGELRFTYFS